IEEAAFSIRCFAEKMMPTVQERLKQTDPYLFTLTDPEIVSYRDDPRYNDPIFRAIQAIRAIDIHSGMSRKEAYWVNIYCEKELKPFHDQAIFALGIARREEEEEENPFLETAKK